MADGAAIGETGAGGLGAVGSSVSGGSKASPNISLKLAAVVPKYTYNAVGGSTPKAEVQKYVHTGNCVEDNR